MTLMFSLWYPVSVFIENREDVDEPQKVVTLERSRYNFSVTQKVVTLERNRYNFSVTQTALLPTTGSIHEVSVGSKDDKSLSN